MSDLNNASSSAKTLPQEHFFERVRLLKGENASLREEKDIVEIKLDQAYLQLDRIFHSLNDNIERATEAMLTGTPIVEELLQCQAILHELKSTQHSSPQNKNSICALSTFDRVYAPPESNDTFSPRGYYKKRCQELEKEVVSLQKDLNEAMDEFDQEFDPINEENQELKEEHKLLRQELIMLQQQLQQQQQQQNSKVIQHQHQHQHQNRNTSRKSLPQHQQQALQQQVETWKQSYSKSYKDLQELKSKHEQLSNERQHFFQRTETLTVENRKLSATFDSNNNQIKKLQQERDLLAVEKQKLISGLNSQQGRIVVLEEQRKVDSHRTNQIIQENTRLKEQLNEFIELDATRTQAPRQQEERGLGLFVSSPPFVPDTNTTSAYSQQSVHNKEHHYGGYQYQHQQQTQQRQSSQLQTTETIKQHMYGQQYQYHHQQQQQQQHVYGRQQQQQQQQHPTQAQRMSWPPAIPPNRDDDNNYRVVVPSSSNGFEDKQNTNVTRYIVPSSVLPTSPYATVPQQNSTRSMTNNGVDLTTFIGDFDVNNINKKLKENSVLQQEQTVMVRTTLSIVSPVVEEKEYVTPGDLLDKICLIDYLFPKGDFDDNTDTNNTGIVSPIFQIFQDTDAKVKGKEWLTLRNRIKGKESILLDEAYTKQSMAKDDVEKQYENIRKAEELIEKKQKLLKKKELEIKSHKDIVEKRKKEIAVFAKKGGVKDDSNNDSGWTLGNLFSSTNNKDDDNDVDDEGKKKISDKDMSKKKINRKENTKQDKLKEKTTASEDRLNMAIIEKKLIEEDIIKQNKRLGEATSGLIRMQEEVADVAARVEVQENTLKNLNNESNFILESWGIKDFAAATSFDINKSRDRRGLSLLLISVLENDVSNASFFLSIGADPNESAVGAVTPILAASYFKLLEMTELLTEKGGSNLASMKRDIFLNETLARGNSSATQHMQDWEGTGKVADQASIPVDNLMEKAGELESSLESQMPFLTVAEKKLHLQLYGFYGLSLVDGEQHRHAMRRAVLLEKSVLQWLQSPLTDIAVKEEMAEILTSLSRKDNKIYCDRKSIVGISNPYEVLGYNFLDSKTILLSPYVTSEVDGFFNVGVLVWAVIPKGETSLYKTLIESTDFLRVKVETDERFPNHRPYVLRLGKDMNLLDLKSTSIFTSQALELFTIDIDEYDLTNLQDTAFEKRFTDTDKKLARAIFRTTASEMEDNQKLITESHLNVSTQLTGGGGTGKTLCIAKMIMMLDAHEKVLVVSRLPRLVSAIKARVKDECTNFRNITFSTYENIFHTLAKEATPPTGEQQSFPMFSKVTYNSFQDFIDFLTDGERKKMRNLFIVSETLWTHIRTIMSNSACLKNFQPLTCEEYKKLPAIFGLSQPQRELVYNLFCEYQKWMDMGDRKWDEADRVLYILKFGGCGLFRNNNPFVFWKERYLHGEGEDLVDDEGGPLAPFFFHKVFVDEGQDFSELDLVLLLRMSSDIRSFFFAGDPAQSVEVGLRMRSNTVNDVFFKNLPENGRLQVKHVLQDIKLQTNHRTHAANLSLSQAVRSILARSFKVPSSKEERALINGPSPEALILPTMKDIIDKSKFQGANIVFLAPDDQVSTLKTFFLKNGVRNDVFGVCEAKGLEFESVALVSFFSHFEKCGSGAEWRNVLLWLFSKTGLTTTESAEAISFRETGKGQKLQACDYILSHPEVEDQAMMLYTAATRARYKLYIVDFYQNDNRKKGERGLADFAVGCLEKLGLLKRVRNIDEGKVEMTSQQQKARGVQMVISAIHFAQRSTNNAEIREKFEAARMRFLPAFGNDIFLSRQTTKNMDAITMKVNLVNSLKKKFYNAADGTYNLKGRFSEIVKFEDQLFKFIDLVAWDSFLYSELEEVLSLVEEVVQGTPYELRFGYLCFELKRKHDSWICEIQAHR